MPDAVRRPPACTSRWPPHRRRGEESKPGDLLSRSPPDHIAAVHSPTSPRPYHTRARRSKVRSRRDPPHVPPASSRCGHGDAEWESSEGRWRGPDKCSRNVDADRVQRGAGARRRDPKVDSEGGRSPGSRQAPSDDLETGVFLLQGLSGDKPWERSPCRRSGSRRVLEPIRGARQNNVANPLSNAETSPQALTGCPGFGCAGRTLLMSAGRTRSSVSAVHDRPS